jgi:hypothetical protein
MKYLYSVSFIKTISFLLLLLCFSQALAQERKEPQEEVERGHRTVQHTGAEERVYARAGKVTRIEFPCEVESGFRKKDDSLSYTVTGNSVSIESSTLSSAGHPFLIHLKNKASFRFRFIEAVDDEQFDSVVVVEDKRDVPYKMACPEG